MITVCDIKKMYDTEFEAQVGAAKTTGFLGEEMIHYQCGTHWHIAHLDPTKRRGVGHKHWRCPKCKTIETNKNAKKHKCDKVNT